MLKVTHWEKHCLWYSLYWL